MNASYLEFFDQLVNESRQLHLNSSSIESQNFHLPAAFAISLMVCSINHYETFSFGMDSQSYSDYKFIEFFQIKIAQIRNMNKLDLIFLNISFESNFLFGFLIYSMIPW